MEGLARPARCGSHVVFLFAPPRGAEGLGFPCPRSLRPFGRERLPFVLSLLPFAACWLSLAGSSCDSAADGPSSFCSPFRTLPRTVRDIRRCHNGTRNMKEKDCVPPEALFVSLRFVGHIFAGTNDPPEVSFFMSLQP